jgi:hypothetical protein
VRTHLFIPLISLTLVGSPILPRTRNAAQEFEKKDQSAQNVLTNFASIVMNLIAMGANPHDKPTLVQGGCAIVAGITNIAQEAFKLIKKEELQNLDQDQIATILYKKLQEKHIPELIADHIVRSTVKKQLLNDF